MNNEFNDLKIIINQEKNILTEIEELFESSENSKSKDEKINLLKKNIYNKSKNFLEVIDNFNLLKPLKSSINEKNESKNNSEIKKNYSVSGEERKYIHDLNSPALEKGTIKRIKNLDSKNVKVQQEVITLQSPYAILSNRVFSKFSKSLSGKNVLKNLERELIQAHLPYTPSGYFSMILFSTLIVFIVSILLAVFFLFFYLSAELPIIYPAQNTPIERVPMVIWIIFVFPLATFFLMYVYPSLEKKSAGAAIEQELPFATIHMAAISGSMIDPSKIFSIMISTKEYPHIEKEFTKLMNEINIYGYDLVSALRNIAFNSPSRKLSELFNGLATTINSGGNLPDFFNKRAESLLFEYKLEKEKSNKAAETFMDIYISVVIAAPMILMLLLMMMKISGLGLNISTSLITLIMVISVSMINIVFIFFLHLKK
jgi:hypothetical protein